MLDYRPYALEVERLIAGGLSQAAARQQVKAANPALRGESLRRAHNVVFRESGSKLLAFADGSVLEQAA